MADSLEDALEWCKVFYEEDNSFDLSIGDFREEVSIWSTKDILHEIGLFQIKNIINMLII
ncbi:hypothetical protein EJM73_06645 [Clostridium botulinum]|uniref:hypothetical protein n=1 Tax=Clostridium botulinum TaxID=1491 RepID=UPI001375CB2E|nr:hypothetical protein [Clostridium botulinum]NCI20636.1 hypothetical protein [Clostridium botulinum]NCI35344.1 hypothetical protein [Clostridium botulinum]NCI72063.1 hypothetical protein [Clostridium botulinum]NDI38177.1 hypothetical protein [Clostridium botulinum]